MLQSSISLLSLPSDLSGPEVLAIYRDLVLTAHTQEVLNVGSSLSKIVF